MKKLIIIAILAAILPAFLARAEDTNDTGNPPKPKQGQGGKCHKQDGNGKQDPNGKPRKKGKPGPDGPKNNQ
jgi:uncharacterized protein YdeI (BOF family)